MMTLKIKEALLSHWGECWLLRCVSGVVHFTKRVCLDMGKAVALSTGGRYGRPRPYGCPINSLPSQDEIGL
jgi:hypothetical protein